MTTPPPDGSRDRRIEDPTNLWIIHPAGRALLPWAVEHRVSANLVSVIGLCLGTMAAVTYGQWQDWRLAVVGLALSIGWLIADGLDGMVARATGTASALGRILDGVCDHGVFILIYVVIASSIGTGEAWAWALGAGAVHIVQSSLYEGERARFHRRARGLPRGAAPTPSRNPVVWSYDRLATGIDRVAIPFDRLFEYRALAPALAAAYAARAILADAADDLAGSEHTGLCNLPGMFLGGSALVSGGSSWSRCPSLQPLASPGTARSKSVCFVNSRRTYPRPPHRYFSVQSKDINQQ